MPLEGSSDESAGERQELQAATAVACLPQMISLSALSLSRTESSTSPVQSLLDSTKSDVSTGKLHIMTLVQAQVYSLSVSHYVHT